MFQYSKTVLVLSAVIASHTLVACAPKNNSGAVKDGHQLNVAAIRSDASLSPEQKSEKLAAGSEQLIAAGAIGPAADVAEEARRFDSKNAKARLLAALLAPSTELRGVLARIEPLVATRPEQYAKYNEKTEEIKSNLVDDGQFLFDGPSDIATEHDVQELVARYVNKLDSLRRTLNELKSTADIELTIDKESLAAISFEAANRGCFAVSSGKDVYEFHGCEQTGRGRHRLNRADLEALQQIVAGAQILLTVSNAWDLSGAYQAMPENISTQKDFENLFANSRFGTLRGSSGIGVIPDLARDLVAGGRYASAMQYELCKHGGPNASNRKGFAFDTGFCIKNQSKFERALAKVELMLKGPATIAVKATTGGDRNETLVVQAPRFFSTPVSDLRTLIPASSDSCGNVTRLNDDTIGGVFEKGAINSLLGRKSSKRPCARS